MFFWLNFGNLLSGFFIVYSCYIKNQLNHKSAHINKVN